MRMRKHCWAKAAKQNAENGLAVGLIDDRENRGSWSDSWNGKPVENCD